MPELLHVWRYAPLWAQPGSGSSHLRRDFLRPIKKREWKETSAFVFTCSWSDFGHRNADGWRDEAWKVIRESEWLNYLILTKRPGLMRSRMPKDWGNGQSYQHVWFGITAENQFWLDSRMEQVRRLRQAGYNPARVFISFEPLLGPIDTTEYLHPEGEVRARAFAARTGLEVVRKEDEQGYYWTVVAAAGASQGDTSSDSKAALQKGVSYALVPGRKRWSESDMALAPEFDWGITGGESGPKGGVRSSDATWFRQVRDQLSKWGIPYFHKQNGGSSHSTDGAWGGRELDGKIWNERPASTIKSENLRLPLLPLSPVG